MWPCAALDEDVESREVRKATSHLISKEVLNLHFEDTRPRKSRDFITTELENETLRLHLHAAISSFISCLLVSPDQ
jgi:hypothetical protein